jgi:hypothetical protein
MVLSWLVISGHICRKPFPLRRDLSPNKFGALILVSTLILFPKLIARRAQTLLGMHADSGWILALYERPAN